MMRLALFIAVLLAPRIQEPSLEELIRDMQKKADAAGSVELHFTSRPFGTMAAQGDFELNFRVVRTAEGTLVADARPGGTSQNAQVAASNLGKSACFIYGKDALTIYLRPGPRALAPPGLAALRRINLRSPYRGQDFLEADLFIAGTPYSECALSTDPILAYTLAPATLLAREPGLTLVGRRKLEGRDCWLLTSKRDSGVRHERLNALEGEASSSPLTKNFFVDIENLRILRLETILDWQQRLGTVRTTFQVSRWKELDGGVAVPALTRQVLVHLGVGDNIRLGFEQSLVFARSGVGIKEAQFHPAEPDREPYAPVVVPTAGEARRALGGDPKNISLRYTLMVANAGLQAGSDPQFDLMIDEVDRLAAAAPRSETLWINRIGLYARAGRTEEVKKLLQSIPEGAEARLAAARVLNVLGEHERARKLMEGSPWRLEAAAERLAAGVDPGEVARGLDDEEKVDLALRWTSCGKPDMAAIERRLAENPRDPFLLAVELARPRRTPEEMTEPLALALESAVAIPAVRPIALDVLRSMVDRAEVPKLMPALSALRKAQPDSVEPLDFLERAERRRNPEEASKIRGRLLEKCASPEGTDGEIVRRQVAAARVAKRASEDGDTQTMLAGCRAYIASMRARGPVGFTVLADRKTGPYALLARHHAGAGTYEGLFRDLVGVSIHGFGTAVVLAAALKAEGALDGFVAAAKEIAKGDPAAAYWAGQLLTEPLFVKRWPEAIEVLEAGQAADPKDLRLPLLLLEACMFDRKFEKGVKTCERMLEALGQKERDTATGLTREGILRRRALYEILSKKNLRAQVTLGELDPDQSELEAWEGWKVATMYVAVQDYGRALRWFARVERQGHRPFMKMALIHDGLGHREEAVRYCNRALRKGFDYDIPEETRVFTPGTDPEAQAKADKTTPASLKTKVLEKLGRDYFVKKRLADPLPVSEEERARIGRWCEALSAEDLLAREDAVEQLRAAGPKAAPMVKEVLDGGDAEASRLARALLDELCEPR